MWMGIGHWSAFGATDFSWQSHAVCMSTPQFHSADDDDEWRGSDSRGLGEVVCVGVTLLSVYCILTDQYAVINRLLEPLFQTLGVRFRSNL